VVETLVELLIGTDEAEGEDDKLEAEEEWQLFTRLN
jgi:hypothetical protein